MCMASYLPSEVDVDVDGLFNGGISNPDGHGWAIADPRLGAIIMGRSLKLEEALDKFIDARRRYPSGPALFHSRWATHGSKSIANVHPFLVGGSHKTVVAHNGVLPFAAHPGKGDDRSDTRLFADEILPTRFRRLDKLSVQQQLSKWCTKSNKLVILTVDPRYQSMSYLVNQSMGEWDDKTGIWHSNGDYREPFGRWAPPSTKSARESADAFMRGDWDCQFCGMGEIDRSGYCRVCSTCEECGFEMGAK